MQHKEDLVVEKKIGRKRKIKQRYNNRNENKVIMNIEAEEKERCNLTVYTILQKCKKISKLKKKEKPLKSSGRFRNGIRPN